MNMSISQVEKRSQLSSYLLAAFAIFTFTMLLLSFINFFESSWSMPTASSQVVHAESSIIPVAIPVPMPPAEQIQISSTPLPGSANPVPQAVPAPVPSVP